MKRHPLDLFSLLTGTILTTVAILSLTTGLDHDVVTSDVFWPLVLIGLGLVALAATIGSGRRDDDEDVTVAGEDLPEGGEDVPEEGDTVES